MARRPRAERKERKPRSERKPRQIAGRGSVVFSMLRNRIEDMRAAGRHQLNREPDGTSEIDPKRSGRNETLVGSGDILKDITAYEAGIEVRGHKRDTGSPYLTLVLSASPEFFRPDGGPPGSEADTVEKAKRLKAWKAATVDWVRDTFGADLVSAIYNGDETTPHIHFAVVPTYERKTGIKPRRLKDEEPDDHAARVADWDMNGPTMKTRSWASNPVLGQKNSAERLRRSYAEAMKPLGLHYALASYEPDNPDTPATHREFRDAERADTKRLKREADERDKRSKSVMDAITALAEEVAGNTIRMTDGGGIQVSNAAAIKAGLPEIKDALKRVAKAATELQAERAEVVQERVALSEERAALEVEKAGVSAEREALAAANAEVSLLKAALQKALGGVKVLAARWKLTKQPDFKAESEAVQKAADEALRLAEQPRKEADGFSL